MIWERSAMKNKLRYTKFHGKGHSKNVITTRIKVNNYMLAMCQRVGCRLRILSKREDVLGGKGKITNTRKDPLLAHYAIAIRSGKNNLKSMQLAPKTTLFHVDSHKREQLALGILYPG